LQPKRGISDEWNCDVENSVDLVDFDALAWRWDCSEVDARLLGDADSIEAMEFEEAAEHLTRQGEASLLRLRDRMSIA